MAWVTVTSLQVGQRLRRPRAEGGMRATLASGRACPLPQGPQWHCGHGFSLTGRCRLWKWLTSRTEKQLRAPSLPGVTARPHPSPFGLLTTEVKEPQKTNIQPIFQTLKSHFFMREYKSISRFDR